MHRSYLKWKKKKNTTDLLKRRIDSQTKHDRWINWNRILRLTQHLWACGVEMMNEWMSYSLHSIFIQWSMVAKKQIVRKKPNGRISFEMKNDVTHVDNTSNYTQKKLVIRFSRTSTNVYISEHIFFSWISMNDAETNVI